MGLYTSALFGLFRQPFWMVVGFLAPMMGAFLGAVTAPAGEPEGGASMPMPKRLAAFAVSGVPGACAVLSALAASTSLVFVDAGRLAAEQRPHVTWGFNVLMFALTVSQARHNGLLPTKFQGPRVRRPKIGGAKQD